MFNFQKIIINDNQRGLLFKNGIFTKVLTAGKHYIWGDSRVELLALEKPLASAVAPLKTLLKNKTLAQEVTSVQVMDQQLALHFEDGNFVEVLPHGQYAFWKNNTNHTFQMVDISTPYIQEDIPTYILDRLGQKYVVRFAVTEFEKGRLYFNQKFVQLLETGVHYFWQTPTCITIDILDTRLTQKQITGQEILTQDKVSLRLNYVCNYRITDYDKILTSIDDYKEQLHVAAQLIIREYVGNHKLDELLAKKEEISQYITNQLRSKAQELYLEIVDGGIKDIILPGDIRDIMNTVLLAEKRAQANVITRREEVASTRSLLNTAKLMDENKTLYRLKELEYLEHICSNVENLNLNGNGALLSQLAELLHGKATS